jgi:hypothetical protein
MGLKKEVPTETVEILKVVNGLEAGALDLAEKPRTKVIGSMAVAESLIASEEFDKLAADYAAAVLHLDERDVSWDHIIGANEPADVSGLRARVWGQEIPLEVPEYRIAS